MIERIVLDDLYTISCDKESCTLYYEKEKGINDKTNNAIYERSQWYYPNLKLALSNYLLKSASNSSTIKEVLERISEVENKISNICK